MNLTCIQSNDSQIEESLRGLLLSVLNRETCCVMNDGDSFWCSGTEFLLQRKYNDCCAEVLNEKSRLLVHSSGTTSGSFKRVIYDSERFLTGMQKVADALALSSSHQAVAFVNPRFIYGLSVAVSHCIAEEEVLFITRDNYTIEDIPFLGKPFLDIYMTPAQAIPFCLKSIPFPDNVTVRFIFAGDKLPQTVANRLSTQYPQSFLTNMYGQVELGPRVSVNHTTSAEFHEGDVGFPLNGVDIALAETSKNETGVLKVRSDYQMLGYLSQKAFIPNDVSHWTETGDIARIDEAGRLFITGRSSKHVNLAGLRIDLSEFERIASSVNGVAISRARVADTQTSFQRVTLMIQPLDDALQTGHTNLLNAVTRALQSEFSELTSFVDIKIQQSTTSEGAGKL